MTKQKGTPLDPGDKDEYRLVRILWYVLLGLFILLKLVDLLGMHQLSFGTDATNPYSILASKPMYVGYNLWAIGLSLINGLTLFFKQRLIFLVSLLLLLIIFVYPFFTSGFGPG